jgi:hypothetical protein
MTGMTKKPEPKAKVEATGDKPEDFKGPIDTEARLAALEKQVEGLTKLARLNGWTVKG